MKAYNIELEIAPGNYVIADLDIDYSWDVDEYVFELNGAEVKGEERPDLYSLAEAWVEANEKELSERAEQEDQDRQDEWAISYAQDKAMDRIQDGE